MKYAGYFLIVADFIQWAKSQGIPVGPGRGSGAGSLVAYALTITDLDPIRFGLLFERFLNPERISMPDFDVDFCQDRRDEVIRYVQQQYGHERVAQIITFGTLQARGVAFITDLQACTRRKDGVRMRMMYPHLQLSQLHVMGFKNSVIRRTCCRSGNSRQPCTTFPTSRFRNSGSRRSRCQRSRKSNRRRRRLLVGMP